MPGEHDVARTQRERLGATQTATVEESDQGAVPNAGRIPTRGLSEQSGGFISAQSRWQLAGDVSPLPRQKRGHIEAIGRSAVRLKGETWLYRRGREG